MSTSPATGDAPVEGATWVGRMGIASGMVVQELGWDDDVDDTLRDAISSVTGEALVDEESDEVVDVVLLWYREADGDLVDVLMDALVSLADNGSIWLLTPRRGRPGYVEPSDIAEAAPTAGLTQTSLMKVGADWSGARLAARKTRTDKR